MTIESGVVSIGPEFFSKSKKDYQNWRWALVREFFQNCIDAEGCTKIEVNLQRGDREENGVKIPFVVMSVTNNGKPMDKETILTKLLSLGSSGKDFKGTVGGFGKAKEILYFCHKEYIIYSGGWIVQGSGAKYTIQMNQAFFRGTQSVITLEFERNPEVSRENFISAITENIETFTKYCTWKGTIHLSSDHDKNNLRILKCHWKPKKVIDDLDWCSLEVRPEKHRDHGYVCVRIHGIPMYRDTINHKATLMVDLKGSPGEKLTANRDSLGHPWIYKLQDLVQEYVVNPLSALDRLKKKGPRMVMYMPESYFNGATASITSTTVRQNGDQTGFSLETKISSMQRVFYVKNEDNSCKKKDIYPETFSLYTKNLAEVWNTIVHKMFRLIVPEHSTTSIFTGFVIHQNLEGQHATTMLCSGEVSNLISINPYPYRYDDETRKSKAEPWSFLPQHRWKLVALACHEVCHIRNRWHDECYASIFTDSMAKVLQHYNEFEECFDVLKISPLLLREKPIV